MGVELNSSTVVTYEYDSASRLVQRVEGGTTTNYTWDGWDLIKEVKSGTVNETTNYLVPFGEILAFERGGDWHYLHGDGLSSTQLVTDDTGAQVGRFIYGAWGEELYASESVSGILESRFVGGLGCRKDAATGLIYMRHRWYDPALQRFISRDPIGLRGGWNVYDYAERNPIIQTDTNGLKPGRDPFVLPKGVKKPSRTRPSQPAVYSEEPYPEEPIFDPGVNVIAAWFVWIFGVGVCKKESQKDLDEACTALWERCRKFVFTDLEDLPQFQDAGKFWGLLNTCDEIRRRCNKGQWPGIGQLGKGYPKGKRPTL